MKGMGVRSTVEQVLALAPDEASRRAGSRLGTAGSWSGTGCGDGAVWGLCRDDDGTSYRTVVDTTAPVYACDCPGRALPCGHALGLLLLRASDGAAIGESAVPDWAGRRLAEGRAGEGTTGGRPADGESVDGGSVDGESVDGESTGGGPVAGESTGGGPADRESADGESADRSPADPVAARRRAERRAARITSGTRELEQRLTDLLRGGLAAAGQTGYGLWEETAARMVDAQAPGLAGRVRELGAIPGSGPGWPVRLLEECALTHLLDRAWLAADRLPAPFATTVRTRVGLPSPVAGAPVRDHWLVLAQYDTGDTRLTTRRVWLYGTTGGRTALVLSYGAAGRAPRLSLPVGAVLDGELTPHTGSGQVRAEPGEHFVPVAGPAAPPPGGPVGEALDAYGRALGGDPWLEAWPVTLSGVVPARAEYGWQLADTDGREAVPLTPAAQTRQGLWRLVALSGGGPVTVFGECGHRGFTPLAAWSPDAPTETVPLL
ncbi:SWIM zinc finger family protein [Streptomyces sp. S1]|uniref:SWIM zinc finger family protein n=1 Tax=Streptomyces sp. S1 TaxID=718288 RepID=UPI001F08F984|nr:SWIM zinc finger family protein [Streptomyces sp. S1]